eukprot:945962-Pyramimonas_sp.AAC.1
MRITTKQHDAVYIMFNSLGGFLQYWLADAQAHRFTDIVEIMGGEGRATKMLLRRMRHEGLRAGKNFDVQCGVDLFNAQERAGMWKYLELCQLVVVVMSPPCQGMAGLATFDRMMNPEKHWASRRISEPLGHFCGEIARY